MSYTREDAAVELANTYAATDVDAMDPDELFDYAVKITRDCRFVRDAFTEDGYLKGDGE